MIHHVVLFRFRADAAQADVDGVGGALLAMKGKIPEIRDIAYGPNLGPSAAEYSHLLLVVADDIAAVRRYVDHPVHVETIARFIAPIRDARLAVDLEVG